MLLSFVIACKWKKSKNIEACSCNGQNKEESSQQVHQERAPDSHVKPKPRLCCQHWKDEGKSFAEAPAESYTFNSIIHKLALFMNDSVAGNLSSCAATDVHISLVPSAVMGADHKDIFPLQNWILLYMTSFQRYLSLVKGLPRLKPTHKLHPQAGEKKTF